MNFLINLLLVATLSFNLALAMHEQTNPVAAPSPLNATQARLLFEAYKRGLLAKKAADAGRPDLAALLSKKPQEVARKPEVQEEAGDTEEEEA